MVDGLKIHRWRQRTGSSPATGTTSSRTSYRSRRLFYKKPSLVHSVAPPLQVEPAALGFDLALAEDLNAAGSIVFGYTTNRQTSARGLPIFFCPFTFSRRYAIVDTGKWQIQISQREPGGTERTASAQKHRAHRVLRCARCFLF